MAEVVTYSLSHTHFVWLITTYLFHLADCHILVSISKVCYEETQKNSNKYVVSENSCSKNFINFQEKHPCEIAFLNKVAGYLTLFFSVLLGNLWNFQNSFHPQMAQLVVTGKCFNQNIFFKKISFDFSHLCFDIQWHVFPGIKCITDVQELNIWIKHIFMF